MEKIENFPAKYNELHENIKAVKDIQQNISRQLEKESIEFIYNEDGVITGISFPSKLIELYKILNDYSEEDTITFSYVVDTDFEEYIRVVELKQCIGCSNINVFELFQEKDDFNEYRYFTHNTAFIIALINNDNDYFGSFQYDILKDLISFTIYERDSEEDSDYYEEYSDYYVKYEN